MSGGGPSSWDGRGSCHPERSGLGPVVVSTELHLKESLSGKPIFAEVRSYESDTSMVLPDFLQILWIGVKLEEVHTEVCLSRVTEKSPLEILAKIKLMTLPIDFCCKTGLCGGRGGPPQLEKNEVGYVWAERETTCDD